MTLPEKMTAIEIAAPGGPDDPHAVSRMELAVRLAPRPTQPGEDSDYSDGLTNWGIRPESGRTRRTTR